MSAPLSRALDAVTVTWRAGTPLYAIELDDGRAWEFYECGVARFYDALEDVEEWAPLADYEPGRE